MPAALRVGLAAFSVVLVVAGLAALVVCRRFLASGEHPFQVRVLHRYAGRVPAPLIALLGATLIYVTWQIPYLGALAVLGALAYAVGAVVTAGLARTTRGQPAT